MPLLMPWGYVPKQTTRSGYWSDASGIAFVIAFLTIFALVARVIQLDEAASERTQVLVLVIGCGAFLAAFFTVVMMEWFAGRWHRLIRALTGTLLCCGLLFPASMVCFAIENRIIKRNLEPGAFDEIRMSEIIWSMIGAMGLFVPTGMRYLLPWPMLVMALGCLLIFYQRSPKGVEQKKLNRSYQ